ncbi:hypothetical protein BH10BAC3_BH10BAC3_40450 [soil metagenome]
MKSYRIIKDNFLGYEAQVKYALLPFMWFQMNDFYWINTWPSPEDAKHFIQQRKSGTYNYIQTEENNSEYEKEVKLLVFQSKNFLPDVVWSGNEEQRQQQTSKRWWPVLQLMGK